MAEMIKSKNGRKFHVEVSQEDRIIYIGTDAEFSDIAAQLIVHEAMEATGYKSSKTWKNMMGADKNLIIGVGYKIPLFTQTAKARVKVQNALTAYAR